MVRNGLHIALENRGTVAYEVVAAHEDADDNEDAVRNVADDAPQGRNCLAQYIRDLLHNADLDLVDISHDGLDEGVLDDAAVALGYLLQRIPQLARVGEVSGVILQ